MDPLICIIAPKASGLSRDQQLYAPPEMTQRPYKDICCPTLITQWSDLNRDSEDNPGKRSYPSQSINMPRARTTYLPDVEMESVGSRQGQSEFRDPQRHTPYESEREDLRRPSMAPAEVSTNSGPSPQRIRFAVIGDLKEFNGRD